MPGDSKMSSPNIPAEAKQTQVHIRIINQRPSRRGSSSLNSASEKKEMWRDLLNKEWENEMEKMSAGTGLGKRFLFGK